MVAEAEVRSELAKLLKSVDFATTSERQIRLRLVEQLGDGVLDFKDVIKNDVDAFLDKQAQEGTTKRKADTPSPTKPAKAAKKAPVTEAPKTANPSTSTASPPSEEFPEHGIDLGGKKRADVSVFRNQVYVSVREWYEKDGKLLPGTKGISLHATDQFSKIVASAEDISAAFADEDEAFELPLSEKRKVTISKYTGKPTVNIREYYEKDGKSLPGKKGIMLGAELWTKLKEHLPLLSQEVDRQKQS